MIILFILNPRFVNGYVLTGNGYAFSLGHPSANTNPALSVMHHDRDRNVICAPRMDDVQGVNAAYR